MDGIWWIPVTGSVWNQLPDRFGKWNSVYRFHLRWAKRGVFSGLLERTVAEAEAVESDEFKVLDAHTSRPTRPRADIRESPLTGRWERQREGGTPSSTPA